MVVTRELEVGCGCGEGGVAAEVDGGEGHDFVEEEGMVHRERGDLGEPWGGFVGIREVVACHRCEAVEELDVGQSEGLILRSE